MSVGAAGTSNAENVTGRSRRTQKERSAASRQMVLDAARQTLVTHGYAGASTWAICRTGDFSKGQLLHHFRTKNDLFLAIIDDMASASLASGEASLREAQVDQRIKVFLDWLWSTLDGDFFALGLEVLTAARTEPVLMEIVKAEADRLGIMLEKRIEDIVTGAPIANEAYLRSALRMSVMMVRGIGLDLVAGGDRAQHRARFTDWRSAVLAIK